MIKQEKMTWVRLPLEKAYNVRELGGLPAEGGRQTLWGAFLRADDISRLTDGDINFLLDYGVKTVIDLRCKSETEEKPDRLNAENGVANINISFMDETNLSPQAIEKIAEVQMGDMYVDMLKRHHTIYKLFEAIAYAEPGCILFHCAAGKDRTGVLAMLLLMLAGVDKGDCMNNYSQSYHNLLRDEQYLSIDVNNSFGHLLESRPSYLEKAYRYVENNGGITAYLKACGLTQTILDHVSERLIGASDSSRAIAG